MPLQSGRPASGSRLAPTADVRGCDPASPPPTPDPIPTPPPIHQGWGAEPKRLQQQGRVYHFLKNSTRDSLCVCVGFGEGGGDTHTLPPFNVCGRERESSGEGGGGEQTWRPARSSIRPLIIHTEQLKTCHVSRNQTRFPQQSAARLRYVQKLSPAGRGGGGGVDDETHRSLSLSLSFLRNKHD